MTHPTGLGEYETWELEEEIKRRRLNGRSKLN